MLIKWIIVSIFVFASTASAQSDGRDNHDRRDNRDRNYFQINQPTPSVRPAPPLQPAPVVQTTPPVEVPVSRVVPRQTTIMTPTSPNVATPTPVVTITPTVVEAPARTRMNRGERRSFVSGVNRDREVRSRVQVVVPSATTTQESTRTDVRWSDRQGERQHFHGRRGENIRIFRSGTTVFTPYYPAYPYYPYNDYYTSTSVYNPNRLFICYEEDQIEEDRYHITCPHSISWYSTYPEYDTAEYRTQYRPEYVCPTYGASYFREFDSSYEATTWWNNFCNTWQSY